MHTATLQTHRQPPETIADVSPWMGYPCFIHVVGIHSETPLAWWSEDGAGRIIERGEFLQPTGLPLNALIPPSELAVIPTDWLTTLDIAPYMQWQLLQAMPSSPYAAELALSSPLLFILFVDWAKQEGISQAVFTALVGRKRTHLLSHIGLPASNSIVKILSRCQLKLRNSAELQLIRQELTLSSSVKILRHVPRLGLRAFMLLERYRAIAWPGLLAMVDPQTKTGNITALGRLLRDTQNMGATERQLKQLQNLAQLHELHDKLVRRFNQQSLHKKSIELRCSFGEYPTAPIPGTSDITPLVSWLDLLEEGSHMHHCVGSYAETVYSGHTFVYRVTAPERLTVALQKRQNRWEVSEIRGFANSRPTDESVECIRQWLVANNNP